MGPQTRMKIPFVDSSLNQVDRCPADHQKIKKDSAHPFCVQRGNVHKPMALLIVGIAALILVQGCKPEEDHNPGPTSSSSSTSSPQNSNAVTSSDAASVLPNAKSCGKFDNVVSKSVPEKLGAEYQVQFKFQPEDCNKSCACEQIAYVQIARVVLKDGTYWDDGSHETSMVRDVKNESGEDDPELNGWFIDNWWWEKYGYYARYSDGSFEKEYIRPGDNKQSPKLPAWIFDKPGDIAINSLVEFVDAPVCLDSGAICNNKLLGYSRWWFTIGNGAYPQKIEGPYFTLDPQSDTLRALKKSVDLAAKQWNDTAHSRDQDIKTFPAAMSALN